MPDLSIVIPAYNEGKNIEPTLRSLHENVRVPFEILVVYDFEEDDTIPVVQRLLPEFPAVRLVRNRICASASGAIRTGFRESKSDRIMVVMADLCDDLTQIHQLLALVPLKADIACPSRYCKGGEQKLKSIKVWFPRVASMLLRMLTGIGTLDTTNSYKLYSGRVLRDFPLISTVSFSVTLEIVSKAHCLGYRIAEIPTVWHDRQHGKSKFKIGRSIPAYLRWFFVALLRNRIFKLPNRWMRKIIGAGPASELENSRERIRYA